MSDELMLPQVPEAKPDDPEDVSWALSTAEAMWARGDHSEGIKWVRRAAEAASEAEHDARALELAKAAADLTGLVTRQVSRQSIDIEELIPISTSTPEPPPVPPARPATSGKTAAKKVTGDSSPPAAPPKGGGAAGPSRTPAAGRVSPSRPPAPLPSRTSQSPSARVSHVPQAPAKPLGTNTSKAGGARGANTKKSRKSRHNLENEARQAAHAEDMTPRKAMYAKGALDVLPAETGETAAPHLPVPSESRDAQSDATIAANVSDIIKQAARSADEWDSSPTQNLTGEELPFGLGDSERKTAVNATPSFNKSTAPSFLRTGGEPPPSKVGSAPRDGTNAPAPLAGTGLGKEAPGKSALPRKSSRPAANEQHDPGIVTSQAVRVVVWRDASGVHVAPAGTVVTAITLDAVLVALEPNADLTAWLSARTAGSPRGR